MMELDTLLKGLVEPHLVAHMNIANCRLSSLSIEANDVFVAMKGLEKDGHDFVYDAIDRGAVAILSERPVSTPTSVPNIVLTNLRGLLPELARRCYPRAQSIKIVAVTGTNGKTSTVVWLAEALNRLGMPCADIGTLGAHFRGHPLDAPELTTKDIFTNYRLLSELAILGATHVALEATSHALVQNRLAGLPIENAILTNVSHDHLDYHGSFQAYCSAKGQLFQWPTLKRAILNTRCEQSLDYCSLCADDVRVLTYGLNDPKADVRAHIISQLSGETTWSVQIGQEQYDGTLPRLPDFMVENALAVFTYLYALGFSPNQSLKAIRDLPRVPGRMAEYGTPSQPRVVIDYAHTPDALGKALRVLKARTAGRLWCVFGCGGERDALKRETMGRMAAEWADHVILTNDNPRRENPETIVNDIQQGFPEGFPCMVIFARKEAIERAIQLADPEDTVLIAGKGHEAYQCIGTVRRPFSDEAVVQETLAIETN